MKKSKALELHEHVLPNWYYESLKIDPFQKFWHKRRFEEVAKLIEPADCQKFLKKAGFKVEVDKKFNLGMLHLIKVRKV